MHNVAIIVYTIYCIIMCRVSSWSRDLWRRSHSLDRELHSGTAIHDILYSVTMYGTAIHVLSRHTCIYMYMYCSDVQCNNA